MVFGETRSVRVKGVYMLQRKQKKNGSFVLVEVNQNRAVNSRTTVVYRRITRNTEVDGENNYNTGLK